MASESDAPLWKLIACCDSVLGQMLHQLQLEFREIARIFFSLCQFYGLKRVSLNKSYVVCSHQQVVVTWPGWRAAAAGLLPAARWSTRTAAAARAPMTRPAATAARLTLTCVTPRDDRRCSADISPRFVYFLIRKFFFLFGRLGSAIKTKVHISTKYFFTFPI